ncbi:MAG: 50S ribosomal protein L7Ae [Candidatus Micrarchaeia archaeon]
MAKSYVKFEVSNDVVAKVYEALQLAKQSGTVRKGANEVTKSVERGLATFVAIAGDVEPEEVVMHIPSICESKKVPYVFVPSKQELGKAIGLNVQCTAVAVEGRGKASGQFEDIVSRITGKAQQKDQEKKEAKPKQEKEASAEKPVNTAV